MGWALNTAFGRRHGNEVVVSEKLIDFAGHIQDVHYSLEEEYSIFKR